MAVAMLVALVLRTVVNRLCALGLKPWMSVVVLLATLVAFGGGVWLLVVPNLLREAQLLVAAVPGYLGSLAEQSRRLHENASFVPDLSRLSDRLEDLMIRFVNSLPLLLVGAGSIAAEMAAALILALFMAHDPHSLFAGALRLVPGEHRGEARRLIRALEKRLRGWVVGTGLAMLFVGVGAGLGLWLLGAPLPLTFGLLAGLLNVVPYFGSVVAALMPALLALTVSPVEALLVLVLFLILNQIDGYLIQPLVMAHEVRLHPVMVILAFLLLGRLLGLAGLLLAVPTAVLLATLMDEVTSEGEKEPGETPGPPPRAEGE